MTIEKPRFSSDEEARDFIRSESPIPPLPEPPVPPALSDDDVELPSEGEPTKPASAIVDTRNQPMDRRQQ